MGMATQGTVLEYSVLGLSLSKDMNEVLKDNPPERITEINRKDMEKLGIDRETFP